MPSNDDNLEHISIERINEKIQSYLMAATATTSTTTTTTKMDKDDIEPTEEATEKMLMKSIQDSGAEIFRKCLHFSKEKSKCIATQRKHPISTEKMFHNALRIYVGEMYKFLKYKQIPPVQTIRAVYATINRFGHSCDPNVEIM